MAKASGKIKKLQRALLDIYAKQQEQLEHIIRTHEEVIVNLNTAQLMEGVDSEGEKLAEYKSQWYKDFKRTLNPRGVTDLKLTGSFHENFFVAVELPLTIWSYDEKTRDLVDKYGKNIFGLTTENKEAFAAGYVTIEMGKFYKRMLRL